MVYELNLMVRNYMIKLATCRLRPCGISLFHLLNALIHPPAKIIDKFYSRSLRYSLLSERLSVSPLYWKQSVTSISYLTVSLPVCAFFVLLLHPPVWKDSCPPSLNQDKCSQRLGPSVILWSKLNCAEAFFIKAPAVWKLLIDRNILFKGPQCVGSSDGLCSSLTVLCE